MWCISYINILGITQIIYLNSKCLKAVINDTFTQFYLSQWEMFVKTIMGETQQGSISITFGRQLDTWS